MEKKAGHGCVLLLLFLFFSNIATERPQLVNFDAWTSNSRIMSTDFETITGSLEFDQPLFLSESMLCPRAEESCEPITCTPCDWSGQNPTGCNDLDCCGPAEYPSFVDSRNDWCAPNPLSYTTVELGVPTSTFTLHAGETTYFRFFLGEETTCYPVAVKARMDYGTANMFLSRVNPFPSSDVDSQFLRETNEFNLGQVDWILCPNIHEDLGPGTWSVGVTAVRDCSFHLDVFLGPEQHPIAASPLAIPCSEVPDSERLQSDGDVSLCLEEGQTQVVEFTPDFETFYAQMVLPIPEGCHTVNVAVAPPRPKDSYPYDFADADLFCLRTDFNAPVSSENSLLAHWQIGDDRLAFTGCFEETTYVHCSAQLWVVGETQFLFSIEAQPHRFSILDTLPGSLTMHQGLGAVTASINGLAHLPCADYYGGCYEWTTYPSSDPLTFWPQHGAVETLDTAFNPIPTTEYFRRDLAEPRQNTISFSIGLELGNDRVYTMDELLEGGTLTLAFVTNEAGEPVELKKPGKMQADSFGSFLPNTAFDSLKIKTDVSSQCRYNSYSVLSELIDSQVNQLLGVRSLSDAAAYQFSMDVYNSGLVRLSCVQAGEQVLKTETQMITKTRQTSCESEPDTPEFDANPCCNPNLEAISCCTPFDLEVEEDLFTVADSELTQTCGSPECAETFFDDLASALNTLNDPLLGCNSGIKNLQVELDFQAETAFDSVLRYCRNQVGLGEGFVGIECFSDGDCANWLGTCGSSGFCDLPALSVLEDQYLNCYINQMSSVTEDYLRREVLSGEIESVPKTSPVFFDSLRLAASEGACVSPSSPLSLSKRTRREWLSLGGTTCKAEQLGLHPTNEEKIWRECPTLNCLGSSSCRGNMADSCYANCDTEWVDFAGETEEECGSDICNVDVSPCEGDDVCVYCAPDGSLPCKVVEGISSQEECEALVACQLPDGEMILGITEEECNTQQGSCSVDCPGESCQSLRGTAGGCFASSITDSDSCDAYSTANGIVTTWLVTDVDSTCALDVFEEDECSMYPSTSWNTCDELTLDECDGTTANQVHLQCYQSLWHSCASQDECENAGSCSDRAAITTLRSENPVQVDLASCFSSGFSLFSIELELPFFCHARMEEPIIGCKEIEFDDQETCKEFEIINGEWYWRRWLTPAMSEEECVNKEFGRYGCLLPGKYAHLSWHNETYCRCIGGFPTYAWEWETGRWIGGQSRSLSWVSIATHSDFEYKENALSFSLLEDWLTEAIEDYFLYNLKSQILCENNVITVPLRTVVCDCLAKDSPKDSSCYELSAGQRATPVGLSAACSGETTLLKGPSAFATFHNTSVNDRCTEVELLVIEQTWFSEPPSSGQVSFQFEKIEPRKGFVKNKNDVTVGQLVGDGTQLEFSSSERVEEFLVCLLVTSSEDDEYPVCDFGWSDSSLDVITPLDISDDVTKTSFSSDSSTFWCANLTLDQIPTQDRGVYRIYPIARIEDYEKHDEDFVDHTTLVLCYILGSFYALDFVLLSIFFFILVKDTLNSPNKSIPIVAWLGVIFAVLCVFRIVFLFAYPNGVFEDKELAEFVVFEIPTFLLFTAVFLCIFFWRNLAQKKNFFRFTTGSTSKRIILGFYIFSVWMLFLVVMIVYSEVILEEGETESDCPGRVASTSSIEDDSRVLSIVYQSIIIAVTFLLAVIFFQSSYVLFKQSSKGVSEAKQFIFRLGAIIVTAFFLRCIFFIILLAAEFTSSIYMFIVLFLTEVFMIFLIHLQFNIRYYRSLFTAGATHLLPSGMNLTLDTPTSRFHSTRGGSGPSYTGTEMDD